MTVRMSAAELKATASKPRNKYGAKKTILDGITFASRAESRRYAVLKQMEAAGEIANLTLQPRYPLVVCGLHVCTYVADFEYDELKSGRRVTEDTKGVKTKDFVIKAKLFHALYGREVQIT